MPLYKAKSSSKQDLQKAVSKNVRELMADNKKSGKERGNKGKPRSRSQILAIAYAKARG